MALSSATATISSAGIGSGLDVNSIVTQLMAVEKQPLTKLQAAGATMQTQLSAFGQLKSAGLRVAGRRRAALQGRRRTSSPTRLFGPDRRSAPAPRRRPSPAPIRSPSARWRRRSRSSARPDSSAPRTAVVGTGSITIRLGGWNAGQTAFAPKAGSSDITIPIGASANTLAGIRDAINAANAGVCATLVTDATGTRIALSSAATGIENGFKISVADDDGNATDAAGLSALAFDPQAGVTRPDAGAAGRQHAGDDQRHRGQRDQQLARRRRRRHDVLDQQGDDEPGHGDGEPQHRRDQGRRQQASSRRTTSSTSSWPRRPSTTPPPSRPRCCRATTRRSASRTSCTAWSRRTAPPRAHSRR